MIPAADSTPSALAKGERLNVHYNQVMPELPEVETVVRDLRPLLCGRRIAAVQAGRKALRRRWSKPWGTVVQGRPVLGIHRRGKWIVIELGGPYLVIHLGMTGQLRVVPASAPTPP